MQCHQSKAAVEQFLEFLEVSLNYCTCRTYTVNMIRHNSTMMPLPAHLADCMTSTTVVNRACKSRARKRGWGQLGAGGPYTPC